MTSFAATLERFGPDRCEAMNEPDARAWCKRLATAHEENFTVLSSLIPSRLTDDCAAVYAFCRWSDDLGDEVGSPDQATRLLAWWRDELSACFAGRPRHPVFVALAPTVARHGLSQEPFSALISAFEQDQVKTRYDTWSELLHYCTRSADPVGRIVLSLFGLATPERFVLSDCTCTALQITNHLQDVRRDLLERDRIYIPREATAAIPDFELRLLASAKQGFACDQTFLAEYRAALAPLVTRTWDLYERGEQLLPTLTPECKPVVALLGAGGQRTLRLLEAWNMETCIHRPRLGRVARMHLFVNAWIGARRASGAGK